MSSEIVPASRLASLLRLWFGRKPQHNSAVLLLNAEPLRCGSLTGLSEVWKAEELLKCVEMPRPDLRSTWLTSKRWIFRLKVSEADQ